MNSFLRRAVEFEKAQLALRAHTLQSLSEGELRDLMAQTGVDVAAAAAVADAGGAPLSFLGEGAASSIQAPAAGGQGKSARAAATGAAGGKQAAATAAVAAPSRARPPPAASAGTTAGSASQAKSAASGLGSTGPGAAGKPAAGRASRK